MANILICAAGRGSRLESKYPNEHKSFVEICGNPMIWYPLTNIASQDPKKVTEDKFYFLFQKEHIKKYKINTKLNKLLKKLKIPQSQVTIIPVEQLTEGTACTAKLAEKFINNDEKLVLINVDQFIEGFELSNLITYCSLLDLDGCLVTFTPPPNDTKWSYCRLEKDKVVEVAEKKVISDIANTGIFYFKRGKDFISAAQSMIDKNIRVNNEFYVSPVYNELINAGQNIGIYHVKQEDGEVFFGLGTVESIEEFECFVIERNEFFEMLEAGVIDENGELIEDDDLEE